MKYNVLKNLSVNGYVATVGDVVDTGEEDARLFNDGVVDHLIAEGAIEEVVDDPVEEDDPVEDKETE